MAITRLNGTLVFIGLLTLSFVLQWQSGAFTAELGGHPDEAAHFVTGLLFYDYLWSGFQSSPLAYAENYYAHYPKVAIGNWPPGFYLLQTTWFLFWGAGVGQLAALQAVMMALWAMLFFLLAGKRFGVLWAAAGAALLIAIPLGQRFSSLFMTEPSVGAATLLAAYAFQLWLERRSLRPLLLFALLSAVAILIKGSALFLALLPPLSIILLGRPKLFLKPSLWLSALIVLAICTPWYLLTFKIASEGWHQQYPSIDFAWQYFKLASETLYRELGAGFAFLLCVGLLSIPLSSLRKRPNNQLPNNQLPNDQSTVPQDIVFAAFFLAVPLFQMIVPAGLEPRHLLPALPAGIYLALLGAKQLSSIRALRSLPRSCSMLASAAVLIFLMQSFSLYRKEFGGFQAMLKYLADEQAAFSSILVSSDSMGEGMLIAAIAEQDSARPSKHVARASKLLAESSWSGEDYRLRFPSDLQLQQYLEKQRFNYLVIDDSLVPEQFEAHHQQLKRLLLQKDSPFQLLAAFNAQRYGKTSRGAILLFSPRSSIGN